MGQSRFLMRYVEEDRSPSETGRPLPAQSDAQQQFYGAYGFFLWRDPWEEGRFHFGYENLGFSEIERSLLGGQNHPSGWIPKSAFPDLRPLCTFPLNGFVLKPATNCPSVSSSFRHNRERTTLRRHTLLANLLGTSPTPGTPRGISDTGLLSSACLTAQSCRPGRARLGRGQCAPVATNRGGARSRSDRSASHRRW